MTLKLCLPVRREGGELSAVLRMWIRIGFNADQDPAFNLNADPDLDLGKQTNADQCESGFWSDFKIPKS
jgi:hypothetical protein